MTNQGGHSGQSRRAARTAAVLALLVATGLVIYYAFFSKNPPLFGFDQFQYGPYFEPTIHFVGFAAVALPAVLVFGLAWPTLAGLLLAAAGLELAQLAVPDRAASLEDMFFSAAGVAGGTVLAAVLVRAARGFRGNGASL